MKRKVFNSGFASFSHVTWWQSNWKWSLQKQPPIDVAVHVNKILKIALYSEKISVNVSLMFCPRWFVSTWYLTKFIKYWRFEDGSLSQTDSEATHWTEGGYGKVGALDLKEKPQSMSLISSVTVMIYWDLAREVYTIHCIVKNIAKGTTDPRVEFTSQHHSSQLTNLEHLTISESRLSINFKISTKHQHLD